MFSFWMAGKCPKPVKLCEALMRFDLIKIMPLAFAMLPGGIVSVPAHTGMYHVSFVVHLPRFTTVRFGTGLQCVS